MSDSTDRAMSGPIKSFIGTLKSSYLVMFLTALFFADLAFPDPLPFLDEVVLFVVTILVARWKGREREAEMDPKPPPKDITPPSSPQ